MGLAAWLAASMWTGLVVGLVELVVVVAQVELSPGGLYRRNSNLFWMIPIANLAIFGLLGLLLGLVVRPLPRVGPRLAVFLLCTLALATPWLSLPGLRALSCLALGAGASSWAAPAIWRRPAALRRLVINTAPFLGVMLLTLAGTTFAAPWVRAWRLAPDMAAPAAAPSVLLIVLDTVRASATSLDGAKRDTTPNLVALAREGVRFDRAIAPAPWTLPSHASMFTGRWPWELEVGAERALDDRYTTLAQYMGQRGYATAGIVANTSFCSAEYGLARGFAHYEDYPVTPLETFRSCALGWMICRRLVPILDRLDVAAGREARNPLELDAYRKSADEVNRDALRWIDQQRSGQPFFLFLNYFDAHDPYLLPEGVSRTFGRAPATLAEQRSLRANEVGVARFPSPSQIATARDAYDDCLAYLDDRIGRLMADLDRRGSLENTLVLITSDHGEHFAEHSIDGAPILGHRHSVYQAEIHVPLLLIARGKAIPGTVLDRAVSLRDVPATIVELSGLREGSPFPGRSLLEPRGSGFALSEFTPARDLPGSLQPPDAPLREVRAVVTADGSYQRFGDGRERLFDLRNDPGERLDLAARAASRGLLDQFRAALGELGPPPADHPRPGIPSGSSEQNAMRSRVPIEPIEGVPGAAPIVADAGSGPGGIDPRRPGGRHLTP